MATNKKTTPAVNSPIGENTVLKLTIPQATHRAAYQKALGKITKLVTVPGFRQGKAPTSVVETQVGRAKVLDQVLEDVLPEIYAQAVKEAGISPLVHPHLEVQELPEDGDWVVSASTAIAPEVKLGDWKKIVKEAGKEHAKNPESTASKPDEKPEDKDQRKLSAIFSKLIEAINPKIAPLLLQHETQRQVEEFARHLASHRMELDQYLKATGKTIENLQQEYAASSLASLQLEFVLDAITKELDPQVTDADISALLGENAGKLPVDSKQRIEEEAKRVIRRRSVLDSLKSLSV